MFYAILAKILSHPKVFKYLLAYAKKTPYSHIMSPDGSETYMERYWVFNPYLRTGAKRKYSWFPLSIRIHKINVPDGDRHLHDHPWNARTFILQGWYRENRNKPRSLNWHRGQGTSARLKFGEYHRITEVSEGGVYTLFVTGKYRGTWGFLVDGVKVRYKTYLADRTVEESESELDKFKDVKKDTVWAHRNGNTYKVLYIANADTSDNTKYPVSVVYQGLGNKKVWCRPLTTWYRSFTKQG